MQENDLLLISAGAKWHLYQVGAKWSICGKIEMYEDIATDTDISRARLFHNIDIFCLRCGVIAHKAGINYDSEL